MPPQTFLSVTEVSRRSPELVQKRYLLKVAALDHDSLQARVSLRDTWNWEADHWDSMIKQFPELGIKNAGTREERTLALDSLDSRTRARADGFARAAIVEANPEWRTEALNKAPEKTMTVGLSADVPSHYFQGLENGNELIRKLDKSGSEPLVFSADGRHYYKITVLDKADQRDILTFAEANSQGILDDMVDNELEKYYHKNREAHAQFRKEDGSWKPLEDVETELADLYLASILQAIHADHADTKATADQLAPLRFYAYLQQVRKELEKDPVASAHLAQEAAPKEDPSKLTARSALADQWKLIQEPVRVQRGDSKDNQSLFTLVPNSWSSLHTAPNGEISFIHVKNVGENALDPAVGAKKLDQLKQLVAGEAERNYMAQVVEELKAKNAISLAYLKQPIETVDTPAPLPEDF